MADKMLDRISKVLHQAENAATEAEAAAFMQKAQELATANAIDLAVARQHQHDKTKRQAPEERTVKIESGYRYSNGMKWKTELYLGIARVNDLKCLIAHSGAAVFPMGFPGDLDVAEALYNSLVIQMVAGCDAALKRNAHKERVVRPKRRKVPIDDAGIRRWEFSLREDRENAYWDGRLEPPTTMYQDVLDDEGNPVMEEQWKTLVDGRIFRVNFYEGFVQRVVGRLWEAKRAAEKEYNKAHGITSEKDENSAGLVLRNKQEEVGEFYDQKLAGMKKVGSYDGAETKRYSSLGQSAGQHAGANAKIGSEVTLGGGARKALD